ncbi:MAG TPA: hypothetical protein DHV88_10445 [Roseburia sp.]|nr:hypothetical protein [Roseburia sp.]
MSKSALYEEKRRPRIASPFGYSFLLVVVLILTFLLFAVLSLSSSLRDYKYSERAADKMSAYYEAYNKAEDVLSEIDSILQQAENKDMALQEISGLPEVKDAADTVTFCVPETDTQELCVKLSITEEADGKTGEMLEWSILEWKETATDVRQEETKLPLMEQQK